MKETEIQSGMVECGNAMDEWFKECKEAFDRMMESAEKIINKGESKNDADC